MPVHHIIITGASESGSIGDAFQSRMLSRGHEVYDLSRSRGFDLQIPQDVDWAMKRHPAPEKVDILVLNASTNHIAPFDAQHMSHVQHVMSVCFLGHMRLLQAVLRYGGLVGGKVLFMLTNNLLLHPPGYLAYNCAKAALQEAMWTLSRELYSQGVAVGGIVLGATNTPSFRASAEKDPDLPKDLPLLEPAEVAEYMECVLELMAFPRHTPWVFSLDRE